MKDACALLDAGGTRGTGFLVSPERLLTCHHVIKSAGDELILATFRHGQYEARVELVDVENDCALLRLTRLVPPSDAKPLALATAPIQKGTAWDGYGFPAATGQAGLLLDGRVQDSAGQDPMLRLAVVLQSANVTAGSWLMGFSGSPVIVEGQVIGQMRQIIPDGTGGAQLAVIYACPAAILADLARRRLGVSAFQAPSPYRGLSAFRPEDALVFFGREVLTKKLWRRFLAIQESPDELRLLAVLGPSGSGKSSVALAGLLPMLRTPPGPGSAPPRVVLFKPGNRPVESLARALVPLLPPDAAVLPASRQVAIELLLRQKDAPAEGLRRFAADLPDIDTAALIVVVDQFEEVYTSCKEPSERNAFVDLLLHAASDPGRHVSVVLTLRSDFLGETQRQHPELNRGIAAQHELVPAMNREELRRIIAEPARQAGRPLDDSVVDLLLAQAHGSDGTLPLLEFALTRIWEGLMAGKEPAVTLKEIGGVGGALARQAQTLYERLSPAGQRTARRVFVRLVQLGEGTRDTRRRVTLSELQGRGETEAQLLDVLRPFADNSARLVTLSAHSDDHAVTAEVTHEALFEHWAELRQWIDESRSDRRFHDRIAEATRLWFEAGLPTGRLWRPPDLDLLREYVNRRLDELTHREFDFYQACSQQQEAERAAKQEVERKLSDAYEQLRQQLLSTYVERGRQLLFQGDALQALLWLQRAYSQDCRDSSLKYLLAEAMRPVDAAELVLAGHSRKVGHAAFSPDGSQVVTASDDATARIWDANTAQTLVTLRGHEASVLCALFSPDGTRIVTASDDKTARLWDAKTGDLLFTLKSHTASVIYAAFSPDGSRIVTASDDKTARLWDPLAGKLLATLAGHAASIEDAAFSPAGTMLVTASEDHTARLWDATTGSLLTTLQGHVLSVLRAVFSQDGERVVTASEDHRARLWSTKTGQLLATLHGHSSSVLTAAFSPDGTQVVTASDDKTARLWDAESGQPIAVLQGHSAGLVQAAYGPDGTSIVTASKDKTARLWDAKTGQPLAVLQGHTERVCQLACSPTALRIVTASKDKTARLWDARIGRLLTSLKGHADIVVKASFSPDGTCVLTASPDQTARLWNAQTGRQLVLLKGHADGLVQAAFSPDGARLLTTSWDQTVRLWDSQTGRQLALLKGHAAVAGHASFSPDGACVVTTSDDQTARLWDAASGQLLATLRGHLASVVHAAFSPDGACLVTASMERTPRLWEAKTGNPRCALQGHTGPIFHAAFSPDGTRLVTASADETARLWDANTGLALAVLQGHADQVLLATFSPDGARVVTASKDKTARLWDASTGHQLAALQEHSATVVHAEFSPDGARVVTASRDKTARLWDTETGYLLAVLQGHAGAVFHAGFSPDGGRLVTASEDKTARVWDVHLETRTSAQLAALIRCRVPLRFQGDVIVPAIPQFDKL